MELNYSGEGTTGWFSDYSYFSQVSNSFVMRGGWINDTASNAGLYNFNNYNGTGNNAYYSSRVVLGV